jgi:hypothetical protein
MAVGLGGLHGGLLGSGFHFQHGSGVAAIPPPSAIVESGAAAVPDSPPSPMLPSSPVPGTPRKFVTPNLTPDPKTGHIYAWSEDAFVARFKAGVATGSPMPWQTFSRMTDDDLRALYRYLRSLPPARMGQDL